MAKKLGLLLAVGAVAGYFYLNQDEDEELDDENGSSNTTPEEDEVVVATQVEEIETFTLKEYYEKVAPPSLNPFNAAGGGKFQIKGSSGEQYKWKDGNKKLFLNDDDGVGWFADDSGGVSMKVAKGFAVDFKVTTENTNYLGDFSGLKQALASRQSKFKIVGSSDGSFVQQTKDLFARMWTNDKINFRLYEGDYISVDIDKEYDDIAQFRIHVDGVNYDNSNGKVDDEVFIRVKNVYKVTPVDAWASETYMFDSENLVFNAGAGVLRRVWLRVTSKVGTKAMRQKAQRELAELATDIGTSVPLKTADNLTLDIATDDIADTAVDRVMRVRAGETVTIGGKTYKGGQILPKGVVSNAAQAAGKDAIGWRWLQNFPIVRTSVGMSAIIGTVYIGGGFYNLLSEDLKDMVMGESCESTCNGFEEGSDDMKECLQECISNKDKRLTMFGAGVLLVGGLVAYGVMDMIIPSKKKEKETTYTAEA
jgi:hypothetical protein